MKSPAEVRSERVRTLVAPVVPAITIGLTLANAWIWVAHWLRDRPNLDQVTIIVVVKIIFLLAAAWYIRRVSLTGRVEATGISLIVLVGFTSATTCLITYYNGNGAVQSMPLCIMIPLLAFFFWPRTWHFVVGTLAALLPPLVQLFVTDHSTDERYLYGQLAAATAIASAFLYDRVRRANHSIARMTAEIEYRATYDGLTGLHTRSHWFEQATRQYAACQRAGRPASLLFLDIDRFKQHNDHAGHVEGDRLLRSAAAALAELAAADHILGRFGGDEFIVLLPDTAQDEAERMAERIREAVARVETSEGRLEVSIGATQARPSEDLDQFISRADHAMFAAKSAARAHKAYRNQPLRHQPLAAPGVPD
jgi:diguanylate cyclase (GGDEF)-like protein